MSKLLKARPGLCMSSKPSITQPSGSLISCNTSCLMQTSGRGALPWPSVFPFAVPPSCSEAASERRNVEGSSLTLSIFKSDQDHSCGDNWFAVQEVSD